MNDRTQIAAMALQSLIASMGIGIHPPNAARAALAFADALLVELAKIPPPASNESPKEGPPSGRTAGEAGGTQTRAADAAAKARRIAEALP